MGINRNNRSQVQGSSNMTMGGPMGGPGYGYMGMNGGGPIPMSMGGPGFGYGYHASQKKEKKKITKGDIKKILGTAIDIMVEISDAGLISFERED